MELFKEKKAGKLRKKAYGDHKYSPAKFSPVRLPDGASARMKKSPRTVHGGISCTRNAGGCVSFFPVFSCWIGWSSPSVSTVKSLHQTLLGIKQSTLFLFLPLQSTPYTQLTYTPILALGRDVGIGD